MVLNSLCIGRMVLALTVLAFFGQVQATAFDKERFEATVAEEMKEWGISGIDVAVIDDQEIIYTSRFGEAKPDGVFRCGSISKLFTAVAVMQLVEEGKLDLDAPLQKYAPEIVPVNPFENSEPITLRQLLCHRSGVVRESPVGGYLDGDEPGFEAMIESVAQTVLPTSPNAKTRYSNVGPSLAGYVVAKVARTKFQDYQREHILAPLDMYQSAWLRKELRGLRVVPSSMRVADGRGGFKQVKTPLFDLGTVPAGNLYTTAKDLAQFVSMLAAGGQAAGGKSILKPETLTEMFTPQLTQEATGFGLGFMVGSFRDRKAVSHNGAVYGYSSSLIFLPKEKVGIVVLGNQDIFNGRIQKLAHLGLSLLLQAKDGTPLPDESEEISLSKAELEKLAGEYESESYWASLQVKNGRLVGDLSSQPAKFRAEEPLRFRVDSALHDSAVAVFERDEQGEISGFRLAGQKYRRVADKPRPLPREWRTLLGSYGPKFIPLVISERNGNLYAMTENMVDYRLTPVNQYVFELPPGMYVNEHLVFFPGRRGKPHSLSLAGMVLKRR